MRNATRTGRVRVAALTAAAVAAIAWPSPSTRRAEACSPPFCQHLVSLPALSYFPANAVRFEVSAVALAIPEGPALEIRTESGVKIAASIKRPPGQTAYFSADEVLEPEKRYVLFYDGRCFPTFSNSGPLPPAPQPQSFGFWVFPSAAPPARAGDLQEVERGTYGDHEGEHGTFVRLALRPSGDFAPYINLTSWVVRVDGKGYRSEPGFPIADATTITIRCQHKVPGGIMDSCGQATSVSPGRHRVELIPRTLGLPEPLPTISAETTIDCRPAMTPDPLPMGGTGGTAAPMDGGRSAGCAVNGSAARPAAPALLAAASLAIGLVAFLSARRRARRHDR